MKCRLYLFLVLFVCVLSTASTSICQTFRNPLLPTGADPWVTSYNGYYYYMDTTGRNLTIWKTRDITELAHAEKKVVWNPPPDTPYSRDLWGPELHRVDGKWYIYFAADDGKNRDHRIYAVENVSDDPLEGEWTFKGRVNDATDRWAIDPTVFENKGRLYMVWSGWEGYQNGQQNLYIAEMSNPWTIISPRVMISAPKYGWEKINYRPDNPSSSPVYVNEGPEILTHEAKIYLVYSASGCWTDDYELGVIEASADADMLNPASWKKFDHPFFKENRKAKVFGPGHNAFFVSPDGKENWILYHANPRSGDGCGGKRSPRIQKFTWNADGTPDFGTPVSTDTPLAKPSTE